jgi:hypothetical protein
MGALHQTVNVCATPFGKQAGIYSPAVADEKLIRLANLKEGLKKIPERERARHLLKNVPDEDGKLSTIGFWSGLLGGKRNFGEKLARRIEDGLEWPRGCLDAEQLMASEEMELLLHFRSMAVGSPLRGQALNVVKALAEAARPQQTKPAEANVVIVKTAGGTNVRGFSKGPAPAAQTSSPTPAAGPPSKKSRARS